MATKDSTLWSWGDSSHGKLGTGPPAKEEAVLSPAKVGKIEGGIAQLEAGLHLSAALTKDGKLYTWSVGSITVPLHHHSPPSPSHVPLQGQRRAFQAGSWDYF